MKKKRKGKLTLEGLTFLEKPFLISNNDNWTLISYQSCFWQPLLFLFLVPTFLSAQSEINLPHLWQLGQQNAINPAAAPDSTYYINLPDIAVATTYSEPSLQEVLRDQNSAQILEIDRAIDLLHPTNNTVSLSLSAQTYRLLYNTPKWSIQQFQTTRLQADTKYPKALAQLGWEGNAPFIGQTLEIGSSFDIFSYQETGIGGSYQIGKWRIGATIKLLAGIGVASTQQSSATLTTSDDIYQLALDTDYEVLAADSDNVEGSINFGMVNLDFTDISLLSFRLPTIDFDISAAFFNRRQANNRGIAGDIGLVYEPNDRWRLGLSVLDIGRINWKENAFQYKAQESNTFNGLNLGRIDFANSEEIFSFDALRDTLSEAIQFTKTAIDFRTKLATQAYLYAQYQHNDHWDFGFAAYNRFGKQARWAGSLSANYRFNRLFYIGLLYAFQEDYWWNIGLHTVIQLGPFQLYAMSNNILYAFKPLHATNQATKLGLALVF